MRRRWRRRWRMRRAMAQRAISRDPEDPWAHFAAGYVHMVSRSTEAAVAELNEAIELNPSLAFAHTILGSTYGYGGMADDGLHHCGLATKLSPRAYFHPATLAVTGLCHLMAERFADAVAFERRAVELRPSFGVAWRTLAAAAGLAGDRDVATKALSEARRLPPLAVGRVGRAISRHRPCEGPRHVHRRTARRGPFVAEPSRVTAPPGSPSGRRRSRRGRRGRARRGCAGPRPSRRRRCRSRG